MVNIRNFIDLDPISPVANTAPVTDFVTLIEDGYNPPREFYKFMHLLLGLLIAVTNLSVVIGSGLILKKAVHPKNTYMLLGNISLADTILGIGLIMTALADEPIRKNIDERDFHIDVNALCIFVQEFRSCPAVVSVLTIGAIAIDRYFYIMHCMHYKSWINTRKVQITILGIWVTGIATIIPAWMNISKIEKCYFIDVFTKVQILIMMIGAITIITAVTILYSIILMKAMVTRKNIESATQLSKEQYLTMKKNRNESTKTNKNTNKTDSIVTLDVKYLHSNSTFGANGETSSIPNEKLRQISNENDSINPVTSEKQKQELKTISKHIEMKFSCHPQKEYKNNRGVILVLLTTCSFIVSWTPFIAATLYFGFICQMTNTEDVCTRSYRQLFRPISSLAICNSLINPFIYAWWHKKYTENIKKFYAKYFRKQL